MLADGAVAAVLLVEAVDTLVARGIAEDRLVRKLRRDPDVWPTWAEIRAAGVLAKMAWATSRLAIEPDRARGAHFDLAFISQDGRRYAIEFKALGLSDAEARFCAQVAPLASALLPRRTGILQMHVDNIERHVSMTREERRLHRGRAEERGLRLDASHLSFASSTIVGHGSEESYVRRLRSRFEETFRQFNSQDECWAAFHWTNGASRHLVRRALAEVEVPAHIRGVILVGAAANLWELASWITFVPRPFDDTNKGTELFFCKDEERNVTEREMNAIDSSCGVRATVVRVPWRDRRVDFLRRDGSRRILPFNFIMNADPTDPEFPRRSGT